MDDARVFWTNVFHVLDYQGRSVEYLAQRLKVSRTALYRWRDGSRVAPATQHEAAADILGIPVHLLFLPTVLTVGSEKATVGSEKEAVA